MGRASTLSFCREHSSAAICCSARESLEVSLGGAVGAVVPVLVAWSLNDGLLHTPPHLTSLVVGALLAIAGYLIVSLANAGRGKLANLLGSFAARDLREESYRALIDADLGTLQGRHSEVYVSRIVQDASSVAVLPTTVANQVLGSAVTVISVLAAMFLLSPPLTGLALVLSLPGAILLRGQGQRVRMSKLRVHDAMEKLLATVSDAFTVPNPTSSTPGCMGGSRIASDGSGQPTARRRRRKRFVRRRGSGFSRC